MTSSAEQQARGNFTPPSRTAAPPADASGASGSSPAVGGPGGGSGGSTSRFSPRNWRVPTRLNAILLIPVLVGLVMGGFQVKQSIDTWSEAQDAEKTALIVRAASEYGQALLNERDLTAQPLLLATSQDARQAAVVTEAYDTTDAARAKFDQAVQDMPSGQGLDRRLQLFKQEEPKLADLRKAAYTKALDPVQTEEGYVKIQHVLMEFANELGLGTGNVTSYGRTVYAVQLAKAAASLQRSIGMHLLVRPSKDENVLAKQTIAFNSYNYLEQIAIGEYVSGGTEADTVRLKEVMTGKAAEGGKRLAAAGLNPPKGPDGSVFTGMATAIGSGTSPEKLKTQDVTPETWMGAATAKFDGYTEIETDLVDRAVNEAAAISDDAKTDAIVNGLIVVIALLTAFILAGLMARQMSRSMRQLRTAAFGIAEQRLPMLVDQLSRTEPGRVDTRVQPIPIDTQDEIGEVARAFDQVHREAVRLAAEQAMLRGNVNAIFTNLSQRNQSLIEGQLTLITDLENNEADPDQLENLFKLDHLATRMRRNGENLLILAGEEPGRRWNQPVPLVDVLRAASSEVESYERIELTGVPETEIHGQAVTDLVHLLAELLENATTFSSPQTKVRVTATRLPDGRVMVEIHDKGIGLTAEDFADINHKLANPPTVDAAVSQRMGLFVVGRLADRHGIRVQLRPSGEQAGTTSLVMLPDAITHGGGGEALPEDDFTVSQIIPEQQSFESAPMRTAAELGFDDSRYEQPSDGSATQLDPVGRSLMREERRAALEAQAHGERPLYRDESPYEQEQAPQQGYGSEYGQEYAQADQGYAQNQQPAYDEYQGGGYQDAYQPANGGYPEHTEQQDPLQGAYAEATYQDPQSTQQQYEGQYDAQPHQGEWADHSGYQTAYEPEYRTEAESAAGAPASASDRVGFERPGPSPSSSHELTDAGLPRRGGNQKPSPAQQVPQQQASQQQWQPQSPEQAPAAQPSGQAPGGSSNGSGSFGGGSSDTDDWRSANDERWQRAEKLRDPKAGGVTSSGLPRRVPKANLIEGTAEQTPQGGPQVSRAPEDVRGRLSNLRRGVQQGRSAGTDTNGPGSGPGSTYNQER
ncbi:sensor histidine kinase [Streptomyces sp. Tu 2975]|uniref:sensor histidine kinase n=1 Tax=Streptomyces sp. Tu 2975 TaxID=2676871 RepID=UPI0014138153|nr:nitrate- and nitrite sensing domain-containing protein [Streptomyces sp. Tu 2975]QIP84461.1 sensor histidine kinase [Streptomyces sp. Tu 2975]